MSCWTRACPPVCVFVGGRRDSRSRLGLCRDGGEPLRVLRWGSWVVAVGRDSTLVAETWGVVEEVDVAAPVHL